MATEDPVAPAPDKVALNAALALEGEAHRRLLAGDRVGAAARLAEAADRYRVSWEAAGPAAYGRLVGLLKARLLSGADPGPDARYVLDTLGPESAGSSPVAAYARAIALLVAGADDDAQVAAAGMRAGADAFGRTAEAIDAIATRDDDRYAAAIGAIVTDFEARDAHLTGVAIADTALMLDALAAPRGLPALPASPVLPVA